MKNRHLFTAAGMTYAPLSLAVYFGHEHMIPEEEGIRPFLFHKWEGTNAQYPRFRMDADGLSGRIRGKLRRMKKGGR